MPAIRLNVIVCLVLAFAVAGPALYGGGARPDGSSPGAVIKNFYEWYIRGIDAGTDPFVKGRKTLLKYVTLRLVKQIERAEARGADVDVFLYTQEFDATWADGANVSYVRVKGATATAIVTFDAATNYPRVRVTLVKEAGVWKIDGVKNSPK
jgi:hypothetical protein